MKRIVQIVALLAMLLMTFANVASTPALAAQPENNQTTVNNDVNGWYGWYHLARVRVWAANVRACPSTSCRVVFTVRYNIRVPVYYRYGGWTNIGYNRWIASYLITW